MNKLRTHFCVDDDLQAFAEGWLNAPAQLCAALDITAADGATVTTLYRDGPYQVQLCNVAGGTVIPPHTHPHADTIEIGVAGAMRLFVNGIDPFAGIPDHLLARRGRWRGIRINRGDVHGTTVPHPGSVFLSIQRWDGDVKSVLTDYAGAPLGHQHGEML